MQIAAMETKTYNPRNLKSLQQETPGLLWSAYLHALDVPASIPLIIDEPTALVTEAKLWSVTPLPVLRDWLSLALLNSYASYLPHAVADLRFGLFKTTLRGVKSPPSRQVAASRLTSDELRDDIGRAYAMRYVFAAERSGGRTDREQDPAGLSPPC